MSSNLFRVTVATVVAALVLGVQPVAGQPTITSRTVVSLGDVGYPVNETTVAAYDDKLVATWNVMAWNGMNFDHSRIGYAVSEDGGESWSDMGFLSRPNGCTGKVYDPTVAADPVGDNAGDFIGGGVIVCGGPEIGHVARMPDGETEFDEPSALSNGSESCPTDYPQLAVGPDPSDPEGATHFYMTCFTRASDAGCGHPGALALFRSTNGGET